MLKPSLIQGKVQVRSEGFLLLQKDIPNLYPKLLHPVHVQEWDTLLKCGTGFTKFCIVKCLLFQNFKMQNKRHKYCSIYDNISGHYIPLHCGMRLKIAHHCSLPRLDTIQDLLSKLDMKSHMHLLEVSIFLLNHVIVRRTLIVEDLCKAST